MWMKEGDSGPAGMHEQVAVWQVLSLQPGGFFQLCCVWDRQYLSSALWQLWSFKKKDPAIFCSNQRFTESPVVISYIITKLINSWVKARSSNQDVIERETSDLWGYVQKIAVFSI